MKATSIHGSRKPALKIKAWRKYRDLTLEDVGGRMDPPRNKSTIQKWENGLRNPKPALQAELAAIFQIDPRELWNLPPLKPERPSVDSLLEDADDDTHRAVYNMARVAVGKR